MCSSVGKPFTRRRKRGAPFRPGSRGKDRLAGRAPQSPGSRSRGAKMTAPPSFAEGACGARLSIFSSGGDNTCPPCRRVPLPRCPPAPYVEVSLISRMISKATTSPSRGSNILDTVNGRCPMRRNEDRDPIPGRKRLPRRSGPLPTSMSHTSSRYTRKPRCRRSLDTSLSCRGGCCAGVCRSARRSGSTKHSFERLPGNVNRAGSPPEAWVSLTSLVSQAVALVPARRVLSRS